MDKRRLSLTIIYGLLALVFCGLLCHNAGQMIYWAAKYDLRLDSVTWFYFGVNTICRGIVVALFTMLAIKSGKRI